jgi:serine/threonine-protein kinase RsbW
MALVELEIPAHRAYLAFARQVVSAAASVEPRFRKERIDDLRIVVSEAITNAVEAHLVQGRDDRIRIRCNLESDHIEVEVFDRGGGFDPDNVPVLPDIDSPERLDHESGLGLPLMRSLADETEIRTTQGGTTVRLVVHRTLSSQEPERP